MSYEADRRGRCPGCFGPDQGYGLGDRSGWVGGRGCGQWAAPVETADLVFPGHLMARYSGLAFVQADRFGVGWFGPPHRRVKPVGWSRYPGCPLWAGLAETYSAVDRVVSCSYKVWVGRHDPDLVAVGLGQAVHALV